MKGKCEVFERNQCLGCEGMLYDLDELKNYCETYKEIMQWENAEQIEF